MVRLGAVAAALLVLIEAGPAAYAADTNFTPVRHAARNCPAIRTCAGGVCTWKHVCVPRGCPEGYGCYPLYGAYGPYGGAAFWSSLSPIDP
jgi:hypothetical protein